MKFIASVDAEPAIDSKAWDAVSESHFRVHDDMPYANIATSMKLLRDKDHLYVRIEGLHPHKHPEDLYQRAPDKDTFTQEYVELAIAPPNANGQVYRLAANPVEGSRYDAVYAPGKRDLVEDKTWNGHWQYRLAVTGKKGPTRCPTVYGPLGSRSPSPTSAPHRNPANPGASTQRAVAMAKASSGSMRPLVPPRRAWGNWSFSTRL
jgi:hypothetical protein